MLKTIKIENFKGLESLRLELAPLTILVGANASGKSSVLEALMLLRQSLGQPLKLDGPLIDFGEFAEVVHKGYTKRWIGIEMHVAPSQDILTYLQNLYAALPEPLKHDKIDEVGYKLEFRNAEIKQTIFVNEKPLLAIGYVKTERNVYESKILYPEKLKSLSSAAPSYVLHRSAFSTSTPPPDLFQEVQSIINFSSLAVDILNNEIKTTYYISALRGDIKRSGSAGSYPEWVGVKGEQTLELLALIAGKREHKEIWEKITKWAEKLGVAELSAGWRGRNLLGADFIDPEFGTVVNVASAGHGSKQTLPLIVQLFYSPRGSLIMFEEPETSLHPDAQIKLPNMFLDAVKDGRQIMVTTHSESFLLALKPLIAKGELKTDEIAVYHFAKTGEGIAVKRLGITSDGIIKGWIPSFAEAQLKLLKDWMEKLPEAKED